MKKLFMAMGIILALLVATSVQSLAEENLIYGCVDKKGHLRIVSNPQECKKKKTAIYWNKVGPEGPQGTQGDPGPPGADGQDGLSCWDYNGNYIADPEEDINADGVWDAKDCQGSENGNADGIRAIQRTVGYGKDGRDSGYLDGRNLVFTKKMDDTSIRILWSDNRRALGYSYGYWEIYINREQCTDPGNMRFWIHQKVGNGYSDLHQMSTFIGYCSATTSGPLIAGTYNIEIQIHGKGDDGDYYVGWNNSQFVIEAEEVY